MEGSCPVGCESTDAGPVAGLHRSRGKDILAGEEGPCKLEKERGEKEEENGEDQRKAACYSNVGLLVSFCHLSLKYIHYFQILKS